ncbi:uncharacterized protein LOC118438042 [Folsomia candida]|uniref:uncharacterized protein LOC118438042 n=1 Tax=Folsomia candida TaxID=158441 RepID=UPI0016050EAC|nr:uncharacterized protein LOC118438042 [Folsomia candida]
MTRNADSCPDPVANIDKKKGCMITNPQGLTKSERKAYRDDVVKNISQQMTSECVLRCEKRGVSTGRFIRSPSGELHEVKEEAEEEESEEEEEERPVTPITRRPDWLYNPRRTSAP